MSAKFPRIPHLPWSPGATADDRRLESVLGFIGRTVVVTEKMDGANVCLTADQLYARSHSGPAKGRMFDRLKAIHAGIAPMIPPHYSVFCEWCLYVHSVEYAELPDPPLFVLAVRDDGTGAWLDWNGTRHLAESLGIRTAPLMAIWPVNNEKDLREAVHDGLSKSKYGPRCEGAIVRVFGPVAEGMFGEFFAKYVAAGFQAGKELDGELREQRVGNLHTP